MGKEPNNEIISVSDYLNRLNATLKTERARVVGEVSGLQEYPGRSYMYFSIRDVKDQSSAKCFMWKNDYKLSGIEIKDGMEIIITTWPNIYKPNGGLTLQVESLELVGDGALKIAYDKLKNKLEEEGLFSEKRKKNIPEYPHKIGVITSKNGAVINDFLTNIGRFGYEIFFVDSKVEGQDAVKDILYSIETLKKIDIDVLVLMRGGGSLESFLAFNNETVVRALANFPKPVITGIGHDKDIPLASLVSDKNVSTPTAVAALLNTGWQKVLSQISLFQEKIISIFQSNLSKKQFDVENSRNIIENRFNSIFDSFKSAEKTLLGSISVIGSEIMRKIDKIENLSQNLIKNFDNLFYKSKEFLVISNKTIESGNPRRQLQRGYSIIKSKGKIIRSKKQVLKGDLVEIMVSDGEIKSQIIN